MKQITREHIQAALVTVNILMPEIVSKIKKRKKCALATLFRICEDVTDNKEFYRLGICLMFLLSAYCEESDPPIINKELCTIVEMHHSGMSSFVSEIADDEQDYLLEYINRIIKNTILEDDQSVAYIGGITQTYSLIKRQIEVNELEALL